MSLRAEIGGAELYHRAALGGFFCGLRRFVRLWRRFFRPHTVDTASVGSQATVIAKECATGFEGLSRPGVILEGAAAAGGTGENHNLLLSLRVTAAVVENYIDRAVGGIDGQPLKKLFAAVVNGIVVHASGVAPVLASVVGRRNEDVEIAVAVIAPGDVEAFAAGVDGDLRKSIGAIERVDGEHQWSGVEYGTGAGETFSAIA